LRRRFFAVAQEATWKFLRIFFKTHTRDARKSTNPFSNKTLVGFLRLIAPHDIPKKFLDIRIEGVYMKIIYFDLFRTTENGCPTLKTCPNTKAASANRGYVAPEV